MDVYHPVQAADNLVELTGAALAMSKYFRGGQELSGGEWQRMAIARGLFRAAPLLIWDEPTAPLDARAEFAVYESLRLLAAGRTVILITHRLASVRNCDRIALLHRGEVAEQGTHGELIDRAGRYAELYALQERIFAGREAGRGPVSAGGVADAVSRVDEPRVSVRPGGGS